MKVFSLLTALFAVNRPSQRVDKVAPLFLKIEGSGLDKDCKIFQVRRRLLERFVNNKPYHGLEHPDLHPGDVVKQKSLILDPETRETIGTVYTLAHVLDENVRLAQGAYNITAGDRTGVINFQALIPNYRAEEEFDMAITSGTGHFHSAQGWIITGHLFENQGALERDATFNICGLYA